jgi:TatA/E family protein of Tat protein translocase
MFSNFGGDKLLVIAIVVLLLFGPKKIPEIAQTIGKVVRMLKKSLKEFEDEIKDSTNSKT